MAMSNFQISPTSSAKVMTLNGEWSSPSLVKVDNEQCVVFGDGYGVLHGFEIPDIEAGHELTTLTELWSMDLNPPDWRKTEDGLAFVYTDDKRLFFKYPENYPDDPEVYKQGFDRASTQTEGPCEIIAMPAVEGKRVYVGLGRDCYYNTGKPQEGMEKLPGKRKYGIGRFMCIQIDDIRTTPTIVWEDRDVSRTQSTASIKDGLVYVADTNGFLHCLDADTGEAYWRHDLGAMVTCREQLLVDGKIYVATDSNEMIILTAGKEEPKELFRDRIGTNLTTVEAADGLLAVGSNKDLRLYGNPGKAVAEKEEAPLP